MKKLIAVFAYTIVSGGIAAAQAASLQSVDTRSGKLEFELGVPTTKTVTKLYDEIDYQRACQLYLWALPVVGMEQGRDAAESTTGARLGDVGIFKGYRNVSIFFTTNVTTPYSIGYQDLTKGPVVIDMPPGAIAGSINDFWQRAITDLGITGPDQGKGGKYVLVGPGQKAPVAEGAFVIRSPTFGIVLFYRALDPDPAKAAAISSGVRVYPWAERAKPPATRFLTPDPDKITKFLMPPRGLQYWERLWAVIQREPVEDRDRFFMAMLKPLGIEKGKPFHPDERQKNILTEGALVGEAMAKANTFDMRFPNIRYRPDANWQYFLILDPVQDLPNYSELDERAAYFYAALFVTAGMRSTKPGVGQAYLGTFRDKDKHAFDGGQTYRLHVPPNPPAKQFWSVTLYDTDTRALIQSKEQRSDRSSRDDIVKNPDGSVDIYFGPTAPKGLEQNWIPTVPGRAWFAGFRFYGPLEPYFDKSWPLPDIQLVK
jgi:hypothetical protein